MECRADEEKNLRGGERKAENAENALAHDTCEDRAEHHAEKGCEVGDDGVERKIIRSILIGQIDIGQGGGDGSRCNTENVLRKSYRDIKPNGVCRHEGVSIISGGVEQKHDGKRAEPIMSGDQFFPHIREEDEEKEISRVDAVAERIADANVLKDVCVKSRIGEVEREGIGSGNQNCAEKAFIFEGECEDIGKLCFCRGRVGKFLRNQPDQAVDDGKREGNESDGNEHGLFLRGILQAVTDGGNRERDGKRDGAVDAACGIEIVYTNVIRQEVCIPGGKAGSKKLVDGVCNDDENDEPEQERFGVFDQHWKQGDANDIDGIERQFTCNKNTFSFFETLQNGG